MRFPSIPNVAKAVRTLSASCRGETTVQLLVSRSEVGAWELVPGEQRISAIHDHCWVGVARVPGQNKAGRPHRFRSEDVARDLIAQAKAQASPQPSGKARKGRTTAPPEDTTLFPIGALVAFYGLPGRVVGHATVESTTGPVQVTLVEASMPGYVPSWNLTVNIVPVVSSALAPWTPPPDSHITTLNQLQGRAHA